MDFILNVVKSVACQGIFLLLAVIIITQLLDPLKQVFRNELSGFTLESGLLAVIGIVLTILALCAILVTAGLPQAWTNWMFLIGCLQTLMLSVLRLGLTNGNSTNTDKDPVDYKHLNDARDDWASPVLQTFMSSANPA